MFFKRLVPFIMIACLLASCNTTSPSTAGSPGLPSPSVPVETSSPDVPSPAPTTDLTPSPDPSPELPPIELEEYKGNLFHVFYHFLNAYPQLSFELGYYKNLDKDCVGPKEFWSSLEELYKNDFVLVDLNDYNEVAQDGTIVNKPIMVPVGKKPLVMSFDDINYYSKNLGKGICDKVILDENGKLAMLTRQADGTELVTYDNDVIPMLESFCEQYPDFAPFGVKGMIALTGYDGILGYRTQSGSENRQSEIEAVKPIIQALKDAGWYFGSHSYSHYHLNDSKTDLERVENDTKKWRDEVGSLVGDTRIYVLPYGERPEWGNAKYGVFTDYGFNIICGVGMPPYYALKGTYAFMDRQNIDGYSLRHHHKWLVPLMDPFVVFCPEERGGEELSAPALAGVVDNNGVPVYREWNGVTIALGGDVTMVSPLADRLKDGGPDAIIDPELAEVFRAADIAMVNLESAVSDLGEPWPGKDYTFRAEPSLLDFLQETLDITLVSLANNHTIDYGNDAFYDTMSRLNDAGIGYVGGGMNLAEAMSPYVIEIEGVSIAFLAASQVAPNMEWYAYENRSGLLMAYDTTLIVDAVKAANELYDYVIVYMHWGKEHTGTPISAQTNAAHKMIDAGADAIIGSHPHCIQSFEVYDGKPIAYSLGNFLMRNRYDHTAAAVLRLHDGKAELEIIPCHVRNWFFTGLAGTKQAGELLQSWRELSPNALIGDDWILREAAM